MQPPDLESAVATIRHLKEQELADPQSSPDSDAADALAKFLLLHVDAEQVRAMAISSAGAAAPPAVMQTQLLHACPSAALTALPVPAHSRTYL